MVSFLILRSETVDTTVWVVASPQPRSTQTTTSFLKFINIFKRNKAIKIRTSELLVDGK